MSVCLFVCLSYLSVSQSDFGVQPAGFLRSISIPIPIFSAAGKRRSVARSEGCCPSPPRPGTWAPGRAWSGRLGQKKGFWGGGTNKSPQGWLAPPSFFFFFFGGGGGFYEPKKRAWWVFLFGFPCETLGARVSQVNKLDLVFFGSPPLGRWMVYFLVAVRHVQ